MEVTAAVLYGGKLAHYDVSIREDGTCDAKLTEFRGNTQSAPPQRVVLHKEGRRWVSDVPDSSPFSTSQPLPRKRRGVAPTKTELSTGPVMFAFGLPLAVLKTPFDASMDT